MFLKRKCPCVIWWRSALIISHYKLRKSSTCSRIKVLMMHSESCIGRVNRICVLSIKRTIWISAQSDFSSVGRAEDCSLCRLILRSLVRIRQVGLTRFFVNLFSNYICTGFAQQVKLSAILWAVLFFFFDRILLLCTHNNIFLLPVAPSWDFIRGSHKSERWELVILAVYKQWLC